MAKKLFVVGSEQTSYGVSAIAQAGAMAGYQVVVSGETLKTARKTVEAARVGLEEKKTKGELSPEKNAEAAARLQAVKGLEESRSSDAVIENVFEKEAQKRETLSALDGLCPDSTMIASSTSTIPITSLATAVKHPERLIGMHFIHFTPVMKVVEIARGELTSDQTMNAARALAKELSLEVAVSQDAPGLLSARTWMVYINEAANCVYNGLGIPENLVALARTISRASLSPLESADYFGIDNCIALLENLHRAYGDPKYLPNPLLVKMAAAGKVGNRSGAGFFQH